MLVLVGKKKKGIERWTVYWKSIRIISSVFLVTSVQGNFSWRERRLWVKGSRLENIWHNEGEMNELNDFESAPPALCWSRNARLHFAAKLSIQVQRLKCPSVCPFSILRPTNACHLNRQAPPLVLLVSETTTHFQWDIKRPCSCCQNNIPPLLRRKDPGRQNPHFFFHYHFFLYLDF